MSHRCQASPDYYFPGCGVLVQRALKMKETGALDVRNQCSGFVYALSVADQFIKTGMYKNILLVCSEKHSFGLDFSTRGRNVSVIFGDGAAACGGGSDKKDEATVVPSASASAAATGTATPSATATATATITPTPSPTPYNGTIKSFALPKDGIDAPVEQLGLLPDNELDTPHNGNTDVGWYYMYDKPGRTNPDNLAGWQQLGGQTTLPAKGNAVFSAHVYWNFKPAPFKNLYYNPTVQIGGQGKLYDATVVLYDWQRDIAVLDVPSLEAPALRFVTGAAHTGDGAIVAGFPENGGYDVRSARVRARIQAHGPDIYRRGTVSRDVYSLYTLVRQGNSGGPLLTPQGRVYGVVFAKSLDDDRTGYALTSNEVKPDLIAGRTAGRPVDTQGCAL